MPTRTTSSAKTRTQQMFSETMTVGSSSAATKRRKTKKRLFTTFGYKFREKSMETKFHEKNWKKRKPIVFSLLLFLWILCWVDFFLVLIDGFSDEWDFVVFLLQTVLFMASLPMFFWKSIRKVWIFIANISTVGMACLMILRQMCVYHGDDCDKQTAISSAICSALPLILVLLLGADCISLLPVWAIISTTFSIAIIPEMEGLPPVIWIIAVVGISFTCSFLESRRSRHLFAVSNELNIKYELAKKYRKKFHETQQVAALNLAQKQQVMSLSMHGIRSLSKAVASNTDEWASLLCCSVMDSTLSDIADSATTTLKWSGFKLADLLQILVQGFQGLPEFHSGRLHLTLDFDPRVMANSFRRISGDPARLLQTLTFLISHSVDQLLSRGGDITLSCKIAKITVDNINIRIIIRDNGPGEDTIAGNGHFGLAYNLSKRIVGLHGGSISISARSQKGCQKTISIPFTIADPIKKMSVLIVIKSEDEDNLSQLLDPMICNVKVVIHGDIDPKIYFKYQLVLFNNIDRPRISVLQRDSISQNGEKKKGMHDTWLILVSKADEISEDDVMTYGFDAAVSRSNLNASTIRDLLMAYEQHSQVQQREQEEKEQQQKLLQLQQQQQQQQQQSRNSIQLQHQLEHMQVQQGSEQTSSIEQQPQRPPHTLSPITKLNRMKVEDVGDESPIVPMSRIQSMTPPDMLAPSSSVLEAPRRASSIQ